MTNITKRPNPMKLLPWTSSPGPVPSIHSRPPPVTPYKIENKKKEVRTEKYKRVVVSICTKNSFYSRINEHKNDSDILVVLNNQCEPTSNLLDLGMGLVFTDVRLLEGLHRYHPGKNSYHPFRICVTVVYKISVSIFSRSREPKIIERVKLL